MSKIRELEERLKRLEAELEILKRRAMLIEQPVPDDPYLNIPSNVELRCAGSAGTSGQFLKTQGAGNNPVWDDPPGVNFEEVADTSLAANASYTPTVTGLFTGYLDYTCMWVLVYCNNKPGIAGWLTAIRDVGGWHGIGRANEIKFENRGTQTYGFVLLRMY